MSEITPQNRFFSSVKLQLFYEISDKLMKKFFLNDFSLYSISKKFIINKTLDKNYLFCWCLNIFSYLCTHILFQCSKIAIFKLFRYYWIDKCISQLQEI